MDFQRPDSPMFLQGSYYELDSEVTHIAGNHDDYVIADDIKFCNLVPIAAFCEYKMTPSSGKRLKRIDYTNVI